MGVLLALGCGGPVETALDVDGGEEGELFALDPDPSEIEVTVDEIQIAQGPFCDPPEDESTKVRLKLEAQMIDHGRPIHQVLYSWTVAEQEDGLRTGDPLFSIGEVEGKGRGIAMDLLFGMAEAEPTSLAAQLSSTFNLVRYAWPNPWATKLGLGGEDYGERLIRIELRDEAWIGSLGGNGQVTTVWDLQGNLVPLEQVQQTPQRVAALYFVRDESAGGPSCGTFLQGGGGYREFIVSNEAMVKSWSVGTEAILRRLEDDIDSLVEYLRVIRPCPPAYANFNRDVSCTWGSSQYRDPYLHALALPDEAYSPNPANLAHLIAVLEAARFDPDPYTVENP
jgi:hypothetical protein